MRELLWPEPHDPTALLSTSHVRSWLRARNMAGKLAGTKWMKARLKLLREYEVYRPAHCVHWLQVETFFTQPSKRMTTQGNPANRANQVSNRMSQ